MTRHAPGATAGGRLPRAAAAGVLAAGFPLLVLAAGTADAQAAGSANRPAQAQIIAPSPPAVANSPHYKANELDVRPGIKVRVNPLYPVRAARENVSGKAVVGLYIDASGAVERVEIERETPAGYGFGASAAGAFRAARFSPAMKGGKRVRALMRVEIRFDAPTPQATKTKAR